MSGRSEHRDNVVGQSGKPAWRDVEKELAFYGSYHHTDGNKLVHFIFVPILVFSGLILLSFLPIPGTTPYRINEYLSFQPSAASITGIGYIIYYFLLEPTAAITFLLAEIPAYLFACSLATNPPAWLPGLNYASKPSAAPFGWAVFVLGWVAQFMGHGLIEKRAPALFDNLVQALVLAPFFVLLELMFALGYKPEMAKRVEAKVRLNIVKMNRDARLKAK